MTATASTPRHPAFDLLGRYGAVFRAAWTHRHELAGPKRLADEAAFLPAALSLQDTPVHPAPRRFAFAIVVLFILALCWAWFGKVDIVAVAPGRIIVSDRTKVIQPLEASVVRRVLVQDGDRVAAGQVLVELDPTMAVADKANVQEQLAAALSEELRTAALLKALDGKGAPVVRTEDATASRLELPALQAQLQSEWQDTLARAAKFDAEIASRRAQAATVRNAAAKTLATLPMARTREADFIRLLQANAVSTHEAQDKTRARTELEQDLNTQRAQGAEAQSALREAEQVKAAWRAEAKRMLHDRHAQAASKRQQLTQDQTKATQRERQTQLTAPVAGIVQQLAIHTAGGVVTPAQPLMIVVPESAQVTAEVSVQNLDIGFIHAGQIAAIKFETFPYTKYGTVDATVHVVTADAVTDEKKGSYYPALLRLDRKAMDIDGKQVNLAPGMNITAEIKTGQRRVIEYLLSPIQRAGGESLRER